MTFSDVSITRDVVQAVRDAVDIVDIASELTRLKRSGQRYKGLCPFHKEKSPSFTINADAGLYYCFGCGAGGDAIKLYMQQSGDDFPAAIEALARRYGIPLPTRRAGGVQRESGPDLTQVLAAAADFFVRELRRSEPARSYLGKREIPTPLIESFGLGYAPDDWRRLLNALRPRFPVEQLEAAGLVGRSQKSGEPYDRFRHRLMFPIHAPNGRLVGFGGRTLGDDRAKYINTAETSEFKKSRLLYGFHQAKRALRESGQAVLVEGYLDVIGAVACGVDTAVAGMGTALTEDQARILARYADEVVVAYDGDEAGEKAFRRGLPILLHAGLAVRRARFPAGHDPDSLRLEAGQEAVKTLIESAGDAIEFELERMLPEDRSPTARSRAAQAMVELLRTVKDEMVRRGYSHRAAERLGVPEDVFLRRLGRQHYFEAAQEAPRREVTSEEERALRLLLRVAETPGAHLPRPLPPAEIFLNADCRNIYAAFCALYRDGGELPPRADEVLGKLSRQGAEGAIDRMARLVLEEISSGDGELDDALSGLMRRYYARRQAELIRDIREAQEHGDHDRLAQLLEEKSSLTRLRHPTMTGRWLPSAP